jgi:hypothetical protein
MFLKGRRTSFFFVISIMAGAIVGCDMFSSDDKGYGTIGPIEGKIKFNVEEGYANPNYVSDPEIMLLLQSDKIYPCCNYTIQTNVRLQDEKLRIDVLNIYKPEICLTATGPAKSRLRLDVPIGEIELQISYSQRIDHYRLIVTEHSIRLDPIKSSFTSPMSTLTWRYPRKSFAYVCGTTTETAWICNEFYDSLLSIPNVTAYEFPDSGVIPYPDSSDGYWNNESSKFFLYKTESDYDEAGRLLQRYSEETLSNYKGVGIYLLNYRNRRLMSWLFTNQL